MGSEDRKVIKVLIHHGWVSVNVKPKNGAVDTCTFFGNDIYFGAADYRDGSYWSGAKMLDTPSFWRLPIAA